MIPQFVSVWIEWIDPIIVYNQIIVPKTYKRIIVWHFDKIKLKSHRPCFLGRSTVNLCRTSLVFPDSVPKSAPLPSMTMKPNLLSSANSAERACNRYLIKGRKTGWQNGSVHDILSPLYETCCRKDKATCWLVEKVRNRCLLSFLFPLPSW